MTRRKRRTTAPGQLPEILAIPDLATALHVAQKTARVWARSGRLGVWSRVGRRIYVTRHALLAALGNTETTVPEQPTSRALPLPDPEIAALLDRRHQ